MVNAKRRWGNMAGIKCGVEECHYWDNMACTADSIEVRSSGDRKVTTSDGTACHTFRPKMK
ncbi:hypothetical protein MTY_0969 [Moorella thermoacetica Y72]|nr:hypothetical protein MTY_0969 [Moorella thermoacetica Y72]